MNGLTLETTQSPRIPPTFGLHFKELQEHRTDSESFLDLRICHDETQNPFLPLF